MAGATEFSGRGYDLVTMFDCLHDMGDPVGAARHVREAIADDGTWMVVEPMAGDRVEDNLNPVGRAYYGFSTLLCTPTSLSQDVGLALGTQAGPATDPGRHHRRRLHPVPGRRRRRSTTCSRSGPSVTGPRRSTVDLIEQAAIEHRVVDRAESGRRLPRRPDRERARRARRRALAYQVYEVPAAPTVAADARPGRSCRRGSGRRRCRTWPGTSA